MAFTCVHEAIIKTLLMNSSYVLSQYTWWPFVLTAVALLRAGLAFRESGRQFVALPANPTYVDVVTGVAQLVSKPQAVDAALDKVRSITARQDLEPAELSATDKQGLLDTYLYVENYLTTQEPLRALTKEGLRNNFPDAFLNDLALREKNTPTSTPAPALPSDPLKV
jgi:hypothetical protein